jgi:chromosome segregation ATPase
MTAPQDSKSQLASSGAMTLEELKKRIEAAAVHYCKVFGPASSDHYDAIACIDAAQAEIAALELEVEEFKNNNRFHRGHTAGYIEAKEKYEAQLTALKAERDRLLIQQARLEFLNEHPESMPYIEDGIWHIPYLMDGAGGLGGGVGEYTSRSFINVIDIARAALQPPTK